MRVQHSCLNSPYAPDAVWKNLPRTIQQEIIARHIRFFVIDAYKVARDTGMGGRINTIMQTCFFAISNVLPPGRPSPPSRMPSARLTASAVKL